MEKVSFKERKVGNSVPRNVLFSFFHGKVLNLSLYRSGKVGGSMA